MGESNRRPDNELLEAWRGGDERAGSELLRRHFPTLYRFFCNKVGADADDLIQQTMISLVRNRDAFRGDCSFRTFLIRIARSRLYDFLRARRRNPVAPDLGVSSVMDLGTRLSRVAADNERDAVLVETLRTLPVELQTVVELHYWEGMTAAEIGEALEVALGTIKSRLRRAKQLLGERLAAAPGKSMILDLDASLRNVRPQVAAP